MPFPFPLRSVLAGEPPRDFRALGQGQLGRRRFVELSLDFLYLEADVTNGGTVDQLTALVAIGGSVERWAGDDSPAVAAACMAIRAATVRSIAEPVIAPTSHGTTPADTDKATGGRKVEQWAGDDSPAVMAALLRT